MGHTVRHSWMTTWRAIASSFFLLSSSISRFSFTFLCLSFHSFAHSSGISSRKERPVTGNSAVKDDSKGVEFWKLKEGAVLVDAAVGRGGDAAGGREGVKVLITFCRGGPDRCFELEHPCPRPSQQDLHKPHSAAATRLHLRSVQRGLVAAKGVERWCARRAPWPLDCIGTWCICGTEGAGFGNVKPTSAACLSVNIAKYWHFGHYKHDQQVPIHQTPIDHSHCEKVDLHGGDCFYLSI
jgi:hypothetical protein